MKELAPGVHLLGNFPAYLINIYLIEDVIIDAGAKYAKKRIMRQTYGRTIRAHALTHAHPDHQGASKFICETFRVPLWCGALDADAMEQGFTTHSLNLPIWAKRLIEKTLSGPAHPVSRRLVEGDEVAGFRVIETPGHTAGHLSYWRESDRVLVVGDVVCNMHMPSGIHGLDVPLGIFTSNGALNRASARKLALLEPEVVCFGHGPPLRDTKKFVDFINKLPE